MSKQRTRTFQPVSQRSASNSEKKRTAQPSTVLQPRSFRSAIAQRYSDRSIAQKTDHNLAQKTANQTNSFGHNEGGHIVFGQTALPIQAKLTLGQPNDKYEQEADRVAAKVVQQINGSQANTAQGSNPQMVQRQGEVQRMSRTASAAQKVSEFNSTVTIQCKSSIPVGPASDDFERSLNRARGSGTQLAPDIRTKMESAMGADFSGVRVHTDNQSDRLNRSIHAQAFTTGNDIFFSRGSYRPSSQSGQELIAHELTHTIQQGARTRLCKPIQPKQSSLLSKTKEEERRQSSSHELTTVGVAPRTTKEMLQAESIIQARAKGEVTNADEKTKLMEKLQKLKIVAEDTREEATEFVQKSKEIREKITSVGKWGVLSGQGKNIAGAVKQFGANDHGLINSAETYNKSGSIMEAGKKLIEENISAENVLKTTGRIALAGLTGGASEVAIRAVDIYKLGKETYKTYEENKKYSEALKGSGPVVEELYKLQTSMENTQKALREQDDEGKTLKAQGESAGEVNIASKLNTILFAVAEKSRELAEEATNINETMGYLNTLAQ